MKTQYTSTKHNILKRKQYKQIRRKHGTQNEYAINKYKTQYTNQKQCKQKKLDTEAQNTIFIKKHNIFLEINFIVSHCNRYISYTIFKKYIYIQYIKRRKILQQSSHL